MTMDLATIKEFAWLSDDYVQGRISGVVLDFHGLGCTGMRNNLDPGDIEISEAGGLILFPYYGPWSWMNRQARKLVDDLVDGVYAAFNLSPEIPLISTGGSMGGCSALIYARYAARPVAACFAFVPACDLLYHYTERPDLPRTMHHAFDSYGEPFDAVLREHSPLHQVDGLPRIPYCIVQGDKDELVNKKQHADRLVAAMRKRDLDVDYVEVPGMGHGGLVPYNVITRRCGFIKAQLASKRQAAKPGSTVPDKRVLVDII